MGSFPNLKNPPIVEAVLAFQADASQAWDKRGVHLRDELLVKFPEFTQIQEQKVFASEISFAPGQEPSGWTASSSSPFSYILHNSDRSAALQIRRDGFGFSLLNSYRTWEKFIDAALEYWDTYKQWMNISAPYNISVRFINLLSYPSEGFELDKYFRHAPKNLEGTEWEFAFFREHYEYVTKDHRFRISSVLSRQLRHPDDSNHHFLLDLGISPLNSLAEYEESIEELLNQMRGLKNKAFFAKLTETAIQPYLPTTR